MKRPYSLSSRQQVRMSVPNNSQWPSIKKIQQQIIKFPYSAYPFPNHTVSADLFNTIVQCNINEQKIDKIVNFKCDNVIALKKIFKIKKKDKKYPQSDNSDRGKNVISTYSFYYEKVQYSLGYILESKRKQNSIFFPNKFNLDKTQIKKTLASVIAALYKQGIVSFLEFAQIGVSQKGVIKVYIAPNVLFDRHDYNPKTKVLILTYLNNVLKQIDAKFPKTLQTKNSIQSFKFKPEFSIQKDIIESEQSFIIEPQPNALLVKKNQQILQEKRKNMLAHEEKSFNDEEENFIGPSGSTNLEHMKLHKEMKKKFENHKLASRVEQNIQSQKKSKILRKLQQKQKIDQLTFQLEQMRKKIRQKIQQKRQKNVYGSKIFKTLATEDQTRQIERDQGEKRYKNVFAEESSSPVFEPVKQTQLQKKRKSSQSSINFYQGMISQQKNINCINIYNPKHFPQKSYYQMVGDDGISVDTYELQIGDDYQMPTLSVPMAMRNSMSPQKVRESMKNSSQANGYSNGSSGQKSRFSESAGGKSFGHIVNLLKPQFAPKKSNIFQEPENQNDQDSKHSVSLKKSIGKDPSEKLSIEKRQQNNRKSKNIEAPVESSGDQIKGLKTVEQFKRDLKHIMHMGSRSPDKSVNGKNGKFQNRLTLPISRSNSRNPETDLIFLRETEYRPKTNHKLSDILIKKCALEQKVKRAMQRTKNAINVLQTAKIRQSGSLNTLKNIFAFE